MKNLVFILILFVLLPANAVIVNWEQLTPAQQAVAVPDLNGRVNCTSEFLDSQPQASEWRVLPALAEGWPQTYTVSNCFKGAIYTNMDEDEEMELIFGVGTKIVAHNLDGSAVPGWPQQLNYYVWSSPACGDIDGDGINEIVAGSRNNTTGNIGELYAFELDGSPVAGFPVTMAGGATMNACLADIDDDNDLEIFINVRNHPNGYTYVYDGDGSVYEGWPQQLDTFPGSSISVGDITGDGVPEIVGLSYNSLYAFDTGGNILAGFPVSQPGYNYSYSQPVLADLDNDGQREIIYGGCSGGGALFVVNSDGSNAAGFPQTVDQWIFATPALADLDGDGELDIVIGDQVSSTDPIDHIYAWQADGLQVDGFPAGPTNAIYAQAGIADLDNDDLPEIMIDDNVFGNGYECYNNDGSHSEDWPLPCGSGWDSITMQMTPIMGDFDLDGFLEIAGAATGFTSYVVECCLWDTESPWNEELAFMPLDGCNIRHDGVYPQEIQPILPAPESCSALILDYNDVLVSWQMQNAMQSGFKLYCNNVLVASIDNPEAREYEHFALNNGAYEYYVTAVYNGEESQPSPSATVDILLPAPVDLAWDMSCGVVYLYWSPPVLRGLTGYNIYRNQQLIATVTDTFYTESGLPEEVYEYYLTAVFSDSLESAPSETLVISVTPVTADQIAGWDYKLHNYPNPFNPRTLIAFQLSQPQQVMLKVYNISGQLIKEFPRREYPAGYNQLWWDGRDIAAQPAASGIYLLRLQAADDYENRKIILLK